MRIVVLALLLGVAAPAPVWSQGGGRDFILRGSGAAMPCAAWNELRVAAGGMFAIQKRESYRSTIGWALGYLSGAARFSEDLDPLRNIDEEQTVAWLIAYCQAHPTTEFRLALEAFIEAHKAR